MRTMKGMKKTAKKKNMKKKKKNMKKKMKPGMVVQEANKKFMKNG